MMHKETGDGESGQHAADSRPGANSERYTPLSTFSFVPQFLAARKESGL